MGKDGGIHCGTNVKWPASLAKLSDIISDGLKNAGYKQEDCQSISGIVIKSLSFRAGRRTFRIPTIEELGRGLRNTQLFQEFTGTNLCDLARKYSISGSRVCEIIMDEIENARRPERKSIWRCYEAVSDIAFTAPKVAQQAYVKGQNGVPWDSRLRLANRALYLLVTSGLPELRSPFPD